MDNQISSQIQNTFRQKMIERIDSDNCDHLSPDQKEYFKDEVEAFNHQVKKDYPKNDDSEARPMVVGYQMKHEETVIDLVKDKKLAEWKTTIVFVTPRPVTPLSIDPKDEATWKGAISEEVQDDPARLHTVLGRCDTVRQLMKLGSNVTLHAFYPEEGFAKREAVHQDIYKKITDDKSNNFSDTPMKYLKNLKPVEVGAIYIMQPPGTFIKPGATEESPAQTNPLNDIENELAQLAKKNKFKVQDLKEQVLITNIGASQAIDAEKASSQFSLCSGALSNPEVQTCFDLRKDTITKGIIPPQQPPEDNTADQGQPDSVSTP